MKLLVLISNIDGLTYVLSSHTLADNLSVLVDENVGAGFIGVEATAS